MPPAPARSSAGTAAAATRTGETEIHECGFWDRIKAAGLMRAGHRQAARERLKEAAACFAAAARVCPRRPHPRLHLARISAALDDRAAAIREAQEALRLGANEPAIHLLAGVIFMDVGENELATQALSRALALNPENELAKGYRALLRWSQGDAVGGAAELSRQPLPDSTAFLARLLLLTEQELRREAAKEALPAHVAELSAPRRRRPLRPLPLRGNGRRLP